MAMQYRTLGRSGLKVSTISLGSWLTFGNTVDQTKTERIVRRAFEKGVNLFDTADVYARGAGEEALGKAIVGLERRHLVIASKCFFPMSDAVNDRGLSRKHIHESVHASLKRLRTEYLDLFQCQRLVQAAVDERSEVAERPAQQRGGGTGGNWDARRIGTHGAANAHGGRRASAKEGDAQEI